MLKSADGWDQTAAFVALIMRRKMKIMREWHSQPATATQHPLSDLTMSPSCLPLATQQWKKKMIRAGLLQRLMAAANTKKGECSHTVDTHQ